VLEAKCANNADTEKDRLNTQNSQDGSILVNVIINCIQWNGNPNDKLDYYFIIKYPDY